MMMICSQLSSQTPSTPAQDSLYDENYHQAMEKVAAGNVPSAIFYLKECIKIRPTAASLYYDLARMYDRLQDATQTLYYARKAYALSPSNLWWEEYLLSTAIKYKKYEEAENVLEERYKRDGRFLDELLGLYVINKHWDSIITTLTAREEENELTPKEFHSLLEAYTQKGEYKTIIKRADAYMRTHPDDTDVARLKLLALHNEGKVDKAWKFFEGYYAAHPTDGRAAYTMMTRYNEDKDYDSIMAASEVVAGDTTMNTAARLKIMELVLPITAQDSTYKVAYEKVLNTLVHNTVEDLQLVYAFVGEYYFVQGEYPEAFKYFRQALHSGYADTEMMKKLLYIESMNQDYESIYVDAMLMLASGFKDADVYTQLGLAAHSKGLVDEAIEAIESAAGMSRSISLEHYGQLMSFLGTLYHEAGDDKRSDMCFEQALAIIPDDASTLNNYAYFLALRKKDLDRALMMSGRALMKERENDSYMDTYAYIMLLKGRNDEALKVMEKLMAMEVEHSIEVLEHYRDILQACGKNDAALDVQKKIDALKKAGENSKEQETSSM